MKRICVLSLLGMLMLAADGESAEKNAPPVWVVESQSDWVAILGESTAVELKDGFVQPIEKEGFFSSKLKTFERKRQLKSITFEQSAVWDNWECIEDITPSGTNDALVFLPVAPGDYYLMAKKTLDLDKKSVSKEEYQKALKKGPKGYQAWHSSDLKTWQHFGQVSRSPWVTTAEYADGKFYIYYDRPNDQDPHLVIDDDLKDGVRGEEKGMAFNDPSNGSDCAVFRDDDGRFHMIYEDWSCIDASKHSWDSPLAGHTSSADGIHFEHGIHPFAIDHRTTPTGKMGEYKHSSSKDGPLSYEIHEPAQNAYGDYTMIKIGQYYHLFGDYHPANGTKSDMRICRFHTDDLNKEFEWSGDIGMGFHPDPSVGFAEGEFYLVMQQETDFKSPGPWVDGVQARVGVDENDDGKVDVWTDWKQIKEGYKQKKGFARIVETIPAVLDVSSLPEGKSFQFQFKTTQLANGVQPLMDRVKLQF